MGVQNDRERTQNRIPLYPTSYSNKNQPKEQHSLAMDEYDQYEGEAEAPAQPDGAFARINGGMLQSGKFVNQIVSLVGNVTAHDTIRTADGSEVKISAEHLAEAEGSGGLIVDPNKAIEIMGQASGPTEITVRTTGIRMCS